MSIVVHGLLGGVLLICGILDWKFKQIPWYLMVAVFLCSCLGCTLAIPSVDWRMRLIGAILGGIFALVSVLSHGAVGMGDCIIISMLGVGIGMVGLSIVLLISLGLLMFLSIFLFLRKKVKKTDTLPYLPFLVIGYGCYLLMGGIYV